MVQEQLAPDRAQIYHFRLDRVLGRGGSGCVYRGIDTRNGKVVAIKLFHAAFFRNRLHLRDVVKSASKFEKYNHPNIVKIYDFIEGDEGNVLIEEYVDGPDLRWYLANRPWNMQERLVVVAQVCNGLQYLHERGCLHHDLKPGNIMFTRKGVVKLTDFSLCGTSYLLSLFDASVHDQVTPMYVAPELIRKEKASPQSDLYSLGVTMYLMFTEHLPFEVDNLPQLYQCHLRILPMHPSHINKRCPAILGDIIMRLLDKRPENRFKDCDELRITLADIGRSRI